MWVNTKAVFAAKTISFVGFCVSYDGIACNPDKVEAIYGMPDEFFNKGDVRTFLVWNSGTHTGEHGL